MTIAYISCRRLLPGFLPAAGKGFVIPPHGQDKACSIRTTTPVHPCGPFYEKFRRVYNMNDRKGAPGEVGLGSDSNSQPRDCVWCVNTTRPTVPKNVTSWGSVCVHMDSFGRLVIVGGGICGGGGAVCPWPKLHLGRHDMSQTSIKANPDRMKLIAYLGRQICLAQNEPEMLPPRAYVLAMSKIRHSSVTMRRNDPGVNV